MPASTSRFQSATHNQKLNSANTSALIELVTVLAIFSISVGGGFLLLSLFAFFQTAIYEHISSSLLLGGLIGVFVLVMREKIRKNSSSH